MKFSLDIGNHFKGVITFKRNPALLVSCPHVFQDIIIIHVTPFFPVSGVCNEGFEDSLNGSLRRAARRLLAPGDMKENCCLITQSFLWPYFNQVFAIQVKRPDSGLPVFVIPLKLFAELHTVFRGTGRWSANGTL